MAKCVIAYNGATFGSYGSSGTQTPVFSKAENPDHTNQKDTRT